MSGGHDVNDAPRLLRTTRPARRWGGRFVAATGAVLVLAAACSAAPAGPPAEFASGPGTPTSSTPAPPSAASTPAPPPVDPIDTSVLNALRGFESCLDEARSAIVGGPTSAPTSSIQLTDPSYAQAIAGCARSSAIVDAIDRARVHQAGLDTQQIEAQNFGYLAWRDCVVERGWDGPDIEPNSDGQLVRYDITSSGTSIPPLDDTIECAESAEARVRSSTCEEPASHGPRRTWTLEYGARRTIQGFQIDILSTSTGGGTWTFTTDQPDLEPVPAEPDSLGRFDLALLSRQVIARPPEGGCALILDALGSDALRSVALVGDSNTANLKSDLHLQDDFSTVERSWVVIGGSGGTWLRDPTIESSGARDELRGVAGIRPSVAVVALGTNDALLRGLAQTAEERRLLAASTASAVREGLETLATVPCVLLTGASTVPTPLLGVGEAFTDAAIEVNDLLREVGQEFPNVRVTDWADESSTHHRPDGADGDWFVDDDDVHLNQAGRRAFADHIVRWMADICTPI